MVVIGCLVASVVGACSLGGADTASTQDSPAGAVDAFVGDDLPEYEPWDSADGECRVLLVGDSLVEATARAQADAFDYLGCESIVDGLAARTLSDGWQCLADGGTSMSIIVRRDAEPGNPTCRPAGLELLAAWSDFTQSTSVTVIALGTNDAASFTRDGWIRHWRRAVDLTAGPIVFVTAAARPGDPWIATVSAYNSALREWCASEQRCTLAAWDETGPANDEASYIDHVHLTREAGDMRAVFIAVIARRVAVPAPPGPRRWSAPTISLPPATSSTVVTPSRSDSSSPSPVEDPSQVVRPSTTTQPSVTQPISPPTPAEEPSQTTTTVPTDPVVTP